MRIALITDAWSPQINGVVTTWRHVTLELERAGHDLLVVEPSQFRTFPCPRYPEIRLAWFPDRKLARLIDAFDPQAIHVATEGTLGLAGREYCLRRGVPFTSSYHTQFPLYLWRYARVPVRLTYAAVRWFHRRAARTLVPTPAIKRELDSRGFRNIVVWTRGVDGELFQRRAKEFLDAPRPAFIYVGRVAIEKNIGAFLDANLPGTKLVIGGGPHLPRLQRRYPQVRFLGYKHGLELAQHVAAADVFVFPSRTDTFGIVMLEAMACGVPVAAHPVTGPLDVVVNGKTGVLDENLERAAMAALAIDPAACREHALRFTWELCAARLLENLAPILSANAGTAAGHAGLLSASVPLSPRLRGGRGDVASER